MLFVEAVLYTPPFRFSMNMNPGLNLHQLQNLSSKLQSPKSIWLGHLIGVHLSQDSGAPMPQHAEVAAKP
jgi:hypothetical protein